jgi:hypothetical protein
MGEKARFLLDCPLEEGGQWTENKGDTSSCRLCTPAVTNLWIRGLICLEEGGGTRSLCMYMVDGRVEVGMPMPIW